MVSSKLIFLGPIASSQNQIGSALMDNEFLLFSEAEFGAFVGKSEIWARKLRYAGRSPVVTYIGRTPKYSRSDIANWMQAQRIGPGGMPAA